MLPQETGVGKSRQVWRQVWRQVSGRGPVALAASGLALGLRIDAQSREKEVSGRARSEQAPVPLGRRGFAGAGAAESAERASQAEGNLRAI